ncbi:fimbria/pilus chaperone family protein [Aeromonas sanarellii]|uniref:fimbria/pilus chaperone family protein n=1 Tax=Aeromonas sanarellii TaxID=633415 RepID=UPI0039A32F4E
MLPSSFIYHPLFCFFLLVSFDSNATGVLPSTSVVVLEESEREAVITITNTDSKPVLLLTTLEDIPEDKENILQISPPAIRVDGGKKQTVRFLLTSTRPLQTERLRRVIFEGVPPKEKGGNRVQVSITQNLPIIIRPESLPRNNAPWKLLKWRFHNGKMTVSNPSSYVVRLAQSVLSLPGKKRWNLSRTYILPSETLALTPENSANATNEQQIRISPATTWGFSVESWDAPLEH